eukprot:gnl/TRDRNA2_/TRDRNA2_179475_c0_seq1.p1 gnl/TRDRNA2_/TRDRNA2_179475_c0~~gnl/TRDRNA2_/TRDRNA2_179475_c0_seq1.p1  ORF type:complete len:286 (-),score=64.32 gnl/TRDRNA2_/TRDRNA2_179475_c0_seq1:179-1036(-)
MPCLAASASPVPAKFDDFSKPANDYLTEDYQTKGFQFKAKQKTSFDGAVVTSAVDLFGKDCATPAKLTWKIPKPIGCPVFAIDKLELDKAGKMKFESALKIDAVPGLKVDLKSDLVDISKATVGINFTGVKDTVIKCETKATSPKDFTAEVTRKVCPPASMGLKFGMATVMKPDLAIRYSQGMCFASVMVKGLGANIIGHAAYEIKCGTFVACTYEQGGKNGPAWCAGFSHKLAGGTVIRAKVQQDQSVSVGLKHQLAKGFTLLGGCKYETKGGNFGYGLQVSIE